VGKLQTARDEKKEMHSITAKDKKGHLEEMSLTLKKLTGKLSRSSLTLGPGGMVKGVPPRKAS